MKKCRNCGEFFPSRPLSFEFYCHKEECQYNSLTREKRMDYKIERIKQTRSISLDHFDLYDLDRPIYHNNKIIDYERVCRVCGAPLRKRDGIYSIHMRYCHKTSSCNGYHLSCLVNWKYISKEYAKSIRDKHINQIKTFAEKKRINKVDPAIKDQLLYNFTICENCGKICFINALGLYWIKRWNLPHLREINAIQIHHIKPVHMLTKDNIYLIWDKRNLKALCPECHHHQNHYLTKKPLTDFMKITDFIE